MTLYDSVGGCVNLSGITYYLSYARVLAQGIIPRAQPGLRGCTAAANNKHQTQLANITFDENIFDLTAQVYFMKNIARTSAVSSSIFFIFLK